MKERCRAVEHATCVTVAVILTGLLCSVAKADDPQLGQHRQQQKKTVELARQLIAAVLDIQLRQFTENGLDKLPVHQDVIQMRTNLDLVTEKDMHVIIDLLHRAQRSEGDQQAVLVREARAKAREVVTVLMTERDRLRRRLKGAHVHAQMRQLIEKQSGVRSDTRQLHDTAKDRRDQATLSALEDQRDTHTLYSQLLKSLDTFQQWDTREGKAASESLAQLQNSQVDGLLTSAETDLSKGDIDKAEREQTEILNQLTAALDKIEAAQGLEPFERSSTLDKIRDLMARQQQLSEDTQSVDAADQPRLDELSGRQHDIREQLGELDAPSSGMANAQEPLRQAKSAAAQAESELFQGNRESALNEQHEVVRQMERLANVFETAEWAPSESESAGHLPSQIAQLEQLDQALEELGKLQEQVVADAASAPETAQQHQQTVAGELGEESQRPRLPESVQQSVQTATAQANQAARTMQDHSPQGSSARTRMAQDVQQALQAARTETIAQLQAAQSQMPQAGAQSTPQIAQRKPPADAASANAAPPDSPGSPRGNRANPLPSDRTDPNAIESQRVVGEAQLSDGHPERIGGRSYTDSPWFARLPPELREAIRMRGRQPPPRGYEERLRRYFESVDK